MKTHTASRAADVSMFASVSASSSAASLAPKGPVLTSKSRFRASHLPDPTSRARVRTRVSASASGASHSATVGVPASPPPEPAGLRVSTPGLIAGALFGGGPFLAWLLRRNDEDAPGNKRPRESTAGEMSREGEMSTRALYRLGSRPTVGAIGAPLPNPLFRTCVYLDYNATTPVFPEVARAMAPFVWDHFGNPSSGHAFAEATRDAIAKARSQVATCVGCAPDEIVFTSCGSESDNHAIASALEHFNEREKLRDASAAAGTARKKNVPHVVTSAVEHPAILEYLIAGEKRGELTYTAVPVDHEGIVDPAAIGDAVGANTCLVTLMHANNEVGAVQPVAAAARAARAKNARVLVHCDAAQSLGKISVRVSDLEVDYLTIVGHKIGAPKGVAATFARREAPWRKLLHGGGQESGRRAGTENVVHIAALGAACALVDAERDRLPQYMEACTDELRRVLRRELGAYGEEDEDDGVRFNGPADAARRLPNTVSVGIKGVSASALLDSLRDEVAASAGAACHSGEAAASISGVLVAMNVPEAYAVGTLRLSVGRHTSVEDVERGAARIVAAAKKQRAEIAEMPEGERPWWCVRKAVGMVE